MADHEVDNPDASTPYLVSRRELIKGVIAAGAVSSASYLFRAPSGWAQASAPGAVERLVTLTVNGQQRRVDVMKQETLQATLRYKLGLTGTKLGCDRSECGACTVLIDDVPHYSCSVLAHTVRGRKVVTIEGLETLTAHFIQFSRASSRNKDSNAPLSGFLMATVSFLKTSSNSTREELAHGVSGNCAVARTMTKSSPR